ncbi:MAG TPA: ABC transporter permease, partial [Gemmatimonadaceae bacterium]
REAGAAHWPLPVREVEVIGRESKTLERVAGVGHTGAGAVVAIENGSASYIRRADVTGDFFAVLGVDPILGRALTRADDVTGSENVVVISHGLWQRRYGGANEVLGRRLMLGDRPFTIVGVMPPDVEYPRGVEAWMTVTSSTSTLTKPAFRIDVDLVARLRPGTTMEQAASELRGLIARLDADAPPGALRGRTPVVRSYTDVVVGDVRTALLVLFGVVWLVLTIASANVANLLLMRGEARRPELAVRAALGSGPGRLIRQLLAESLVLALCAGLIGLAVTSWTLQALVALVPAGLPRVASIRIDAGVVLFTIAVAFGTAALAGLVPALSASRLDLVTQLQAGGRGATGSAARHGRRTLVVAQVALAVAVVAAASVLTRSLARLQAVDMGLAADRLVFVELALPRAKSTDRTRHLQFLKDVVAQLEAAPHIAAATPLNVQPFSGVGGWELPLFTAEGQSADRAAANPSLNLESVHPNYFATFQIPLVRGRPFTNADREGAPDVAIVSEDVAARTWPGEDPIGKRIKFGGPDSNGSWRAIVGVARRTRYRELFEARATLYLPAEQFIVAAQMLALRTASPLPLVAGLARERVRAVDPDAHVMRVAAFSE